MIIGQPGMLCPVTKMQEGRLEQRLHDTCPQFGAKSMKGKAGKKFNEDAQGCIKGLFCVPGGVDFVKGGKTSKMNQEEEGEWFHGFYVGDGHNGPYAAEFCKRYLLRNVKAVFSELSEEHRQRSLRNVEHCNNYCSDDDNNFEACAESSLRGACQHDGSGSEMAMSSLLTANNVLMEAFMRTDKQFSDFPESGCVGTTALVVLVGEQYLCVGSCGDSRAVLFRGGKPEVLNTEHKVDLPQEKARILNAGGTVSESRVMGILNMSRAIGDGCLRQFGVIPDPDVLPWKRTNCDEFLVMATDGLWDVLSNEVVYSVVSLAIKFAAKQKYTKERALEMAALRLCRQACDCGSVDDVTAVVVDMCPP